MANSSRLFRSLWRRPALPRPAAPQLRVNRLEDRCTPSISIPLNSYVWTQYGPSPIAPAPQGQTPATPGNLTTAGRVYQVVSATALPTDTDAVKQARANTLYASTVGGGVWKSTDGGQNWQPRTDNLIGSDILDRSADPNDPAGPRATIGVTDASLRMGAIAVAPTNPNLIFAGEGNPGFTDIIDGSTGIGYEPGYADQQYAGNGLLRSTDGGATWNLIKGPTLAGGQAAFEGIAISKIVFHPTDPNIVFVLTQGEQSFNLNTLGGTPKSSAVWRTTDGGLTWVNITQRLPLAVPSAPDGPGPVDATRPFTDFTLDQANPDVGYVSVGDPRAFTQGNGFFGYRLNGVYRGTGLLGDPANANYTAAFGGNGSFVPGSALGVSRVETAPSQSSTVYVLVAQPNSPAGGTLTSGQNTLRPRLGLFKSTEAGTNFIALPNDPQFDFIYGGGGYAGYNLSLLVSPTDPNVVILAGRGGPLTATGATTSAGIILSTDGGLTWTNISAAGGTGPQQVIRTIRFDAIGRILTATDGGVFRFDRGSQSWVALNGSAGPTGLANTEVTASGLPSFSVDQFVSSTYGSGTTRFNDAGDAVTGPISPTDPRYAQLFTHPVVDAAPFGGQVYYDTTANVAPDATTVYRAGSRTNDSVPLTAIVKKSTDGGQTWTAAGTGITNPERSADDPAFFMDPSNSQRMYFGTDVVNVTENGAASWGRTLTGVQIPDLPWVTNIGGPRGYIPITNVAVSRFDSRYIYASVADRIKVINGVQVSFGPALYLCDMNIVSPNDPKWVEVTPGAGGPVIYTGTGAVDTPVSNALSGFPYSQVTSITVDPNDRRIVYLTVDTGAATGRVWRSTNSGTTWTDISFDLPAGNRVVSGVSVGSIRPFTLALDPNLLAGPSDDTVYIGTSVGVWALTNPTDTTPTGRWTRVGGDKGMPDVIVHDLDINTTTGVLAASTYGRGVWEFQIRPLISGSVFEDVDGNGLRTLAPASAVEPPRAGQVVTAFNIGEQAENANTVTRSNGFYEVRSLRNGDYEIRTGTAATDYRTSPDPIYTGVTQNTTIPGNVGPGGVTQITPPADIGSFKLTDISGTVFDDLNGNGVRDANEPGKAGVVVQLTARNKAGAVVTAVNPATGLAVPSVTTDANGRYSFTGLAPMQDKSFGFSATTGYYVNSYIVRQVQPTGTVQSNALTPDLRLKSGQSYTTGTDLADFTLVTIQGVVFDDTNGDGVRQGEPRLGGVTVSLLNAGPDGKLGTADDGPTLTQVSDPNGTYAFPNLGPGTYFVREETATLPSGYTPTSQNPQGPIVPKSGQGLATPPRDPSVPAALGPFDFGNFRNAGIAGVVFEDDNGDGRRQPLETRPVVGATVILIDPGADNDSRTEADNTVLATATSDAAGNYSFSGLQPLVAGNGRAYYTRVIQPNALFVQTSADAKVQLTSGIVTGGQNLGYFRRTVISGFAFEDINGNGVQDAGEPAAANFPVSLLNSDNPAQVVGTATTDATGQYRFQYDPSNPAGFSGGPLQLNADTQGPGGAVIAYRISVNLPNVVQTNAPGDLVLTSGVPAAGPTLALFRTVGFAGVVYDDTNGNTTRDPGEPGVSGVLVQLVTPSGAVAVNQATGQPIQTTTAADGSYTIQAPNGTFTVRLQNLATGTITTTAAPAPILTSSGLVIPPIDLGTFRTFNVSGVVYDDLNGSGGRDPGEPGLANIQVRLVTSAGAATAYVATTDGNGAYTIAGVGPGSFRITPLLPGSVFFTSPSGPVVFAASSGLVLPTSTVPTTFGVFRGATVAGNVFEDLNRNGAADSGEPGSAGWTVQVVNAAGTVLGSGTSDANGNYTIGSLPAGAAAVQLADRAGWLRTLSPVPLGTALTSGGTATPGRLGGVRLGSVAGTVFNDANRNGRLDNSETGLVGVTVELVQNGNLVASTTSGAGGAFQFLGLGGGAYTLRLNAGSIPSGRVQTGPQTNGLTYPLTVTEGSGTAGNQLTGEDFGVAGRKRYAVAADGGGGPRVQVYDAVSGALVSDQFVYEQSFTGGVRVASGDVNGDGVDDLVTVAGVGGGPRVRVLDGVTGATLYDYFAYEPSFRLGLYVAVADVNGDGFADIITGTDQGGGPRVTVFSGKDGSQILDFFAFDSDFRGGVRIGAGDIDGDGKAEVIAASGPGLAAEVRVFNSTGQRINTFNPVDPGFTGGLFVAGGATDPNTGRANLLVGTGAGYADQGYAFVFDGLTGQQIFQLEAFPQGPNDDTLYTGDVRVASFDTTGDSVPEIVIASGAGARSEVRFLDGNNRREVSTLFPFEAAFLGGLFVG